MDGELELSARAGVDRHVRACAECRVKVHEFRHASDLFRRVPTQRVPMSLRRDLYKRIDDADRRQRAFFGFPLPSANTLGVAVSAVLIAVMLPQLLGVWAIVSSRGGQQSQTASSSMESPALSATAVALPTTTIPAVAPLVLSTSVPEPSPSPVNTPVVSAPQTGAPPASSPTTAPAAQTTQAAQVTGAQPQSGAGRPAQQVQQTPAAQAPVTTPRPSATVPMAQPAQPTATTVAVLRAISGQVTNVNKPLRVITVQTGINAEGGARAWSVQLTDGTQVLYRDGQRIRVEDVGLADYVEVSGFEIGAAPLQASSLKVTSSAAPPVAVRPKVLLMLDGASSMRAPQYGFTGDWIKRLSETGYDVTAVDPSTIGGTTNLKDFSLIAIGYPATLSNAAINNVVGSKVPVLNAEPRLVQALGLGLNVDPQQPTKMVSGKTVEVAGSASPVTRGFSGEVTVGGDIYRTPIVSNGTVLGTVTDGGQKRAVWSFTGNAMYFGFWYSNTGQNHNVAYWTLFDRSVLLLMGKDPLAARSTSPATTTPAR